jgi:hypothetical protein
MAAALVCAVEQSLTSTLAFSTTPHRKKALHADEAPIDFATGFDHSPIASLRRSKHAHRRHAHSSRPGS